MKKQICVLLTVLLLAMTCVVPVLAEERVVSIGGNTYYDNKEEKFLYYVDDNDDLLVYSNVADGMITTQSVTIKSTGSPALELYRNGTKLEGKPTGSFSSAGDYVLMYTGGQTSQQVFSFSIAADVTCRVNGYTIPMGFEVTAVTLDGAPVKYSANHIPMLEEGNYDIRYRCRRTNIPYQLTLQTDYTGPTLKLEGVEKGVARGPVDISDAKKAEVVNIYRDGEKILRQDVLTASGEYHIELADEAGNKTTYTFTILIYFDGNSWLFILIIVLAAVAVVVYLLRARKHLRVR